jgi:hypothetical protein
LGAYHLVLLLNGSIPAAKAADIGSAMTGLRLGGAAHSSIEGTSHQARVVVLELSLFLLGS